jgi:ketosteroid isomerase-like protein
MTDDDAVLAADDARLAALVACDLDALFGIVRAELVFVHADGRREGKAAFLEHTGSGRVRYRAITRGETHVTVSGDVAVLCARAELEVTVAGEPRSSPLRYMSVWTRGPSGWQLFAIDNVR